LIPPAPPVPLPSTGPVIPIPIFSGAEKTLINGLPAARCGDLGLGIWCGGYFPLYEVFLGSSNVWIEGQRAGRMGVDITKHCIFTSPRPQDPPIGPMFGTTITGSSNVLIGGVPMPSLLSLGIGAACKGIGKLVGKGARALGRVAKRLGRNLKPGFLKCSILRAEPVNVLTGEVELDQLDFELRWPLPITWSRRYKSRNSYAGVCGRGWETPADARLTREPDGSITFEDGISGAAIFPFAPDDGPVLEFVDGALLTGAGASLEVRVKSGLTYYFASLTTPGQTVPVQKIANSSGRWVSFHRDSNGLHEIESDCGPRLQVVSYAGRALEVRLHHPAEAEPRTLARYEYDSVGNLCAAYDQLGSPYRFDYTHDGLIRHTDRNNLSFYYEYGPIGPETRVIRSWGDGGLYNYSFQYDLKDRQVRVTNSLGASTTIELDERDLPVKETDSLGGVTQFEYDEVGRTTIVIDPGALRTEYHYDERGNLVKLLRPDGQALITKFDEHSRPVAVSGPDGTTWRQSWDGRDLLTRQVSPLGAESRYEYDDRGQMTAFVSPTGGRASLVYDAYGNLSQLTDALGHATRFTYDVLGNVTAKTDALDHRTSYAYDLKGRLIETVLPSGLRTLCDYDPEDNLIRYIDENGGITRLEYCGLGRIKRRTQPDGQFIDYRYDTEEQLVRVTNQLGEHYLLRRDALGRVVEEVDYWGQGTKYSYTLSGFVQERLDPMGRLTRFETDPLGRILTKSTYDQNDDLQSVESFTFDKNGNLTAAQNADTRIERHFDAEGRLLEEKQGEAFVLRNRYDLSGNRIEREIDFPQAAFASTVRFEFDALDQARAVQIDTCHTIAIERNALGQIVAEQLSQSLRREIGYNSDGYLAGQRVSNGAAILDVHYQYDNAGNVLAKRDSQYGTDRFHYDSLGRLLSHVDPAQALTKYVNDFAGDRLWTRVSTSGINAGQGSDGHWERLGTYRRTSYRFDRAGALVQRTGAHQNCLFEWDGQQRLRKFTDDGRETTYAYDPLARRIAKVVGGDQTLFYWDGDALVADMIPATSDRAGQIRQWVYYPDTFEPLAVVQRKGDAEPDGGESTSGAVYLYQNDPNGCPARLLSGDGKVLWAARLTAWGAVERLEISHVENPLRLQGQYYDAESGLHYNLHRFYNPDTGQFISSDPLGLAGGHNLTAYGPNIWSWTDPLGLLCKWIRTWTRKHTAAGKLPRFSGRSRGYVERNLRARGFQPDAANPNHWWHPDGSRVRIDPPHVPGRGPAMGGYRGDVENHVHKEWRDASGVFNNLDDYGRLNSDPNRTHIILK
jgi:RHS repeat-associated protein